MYGGDKAGRIGQMDTYLVALIVKMVSMERRSSTPPLSKYWTAIRARTTQASALRWARCHSATAAAATGIACARHHNSLLAAVRGAPPCTTRHSSLLAASSFSYSCSPQARARPCCNPPSPPSMGTKGEKPPGAPHFRSPGASPSRTLTTVPSDDDSNICKYRKFLALRDLFH